MSHEKLSALPGGTAVAAVDTPALFAWLKDRHDSIVNDLTTLVNLETPSTDKALLDEALEWLETWSDAMLGKPDSRHRSPGGRYGDILISEYAGESEKLITFVCHYDTVWEKGTLADWPLAIDGDHATGPGIYDMKAGLIQSVWALRALKEASLARPRIRLLFTGDEEIGSPAARPVIEDACRDADAVIVFEPSEQGRIKTARKGVGRFTLRLSGVEAHAGADYTKGVSAVDELARAVLGLHALTDLDAGTTVNVGVVSGGTRSNVVAGSAEADIDVRVTSASEMARVDAALADLKPANGRARLTIDGEWNRPPMERGPLTVQMYELAAVAGRSIGIELGEISVGGGSDGNFAAALGVPVLDGMGAVGGGPHARHEHISLSGMAERAAIAAAVVASFAGTTSG
ncbi:M20 family metallopeptidase [Streptomyces sp. NPDC004542]|uniref:M20 family metallopeptidase n=1 Tax=Streptomyces sp. NPDC004542 TaxID=3154281 RepID=UPI0033B53FD2